MNNSFDYLMSRFLLNYAEGECDEEIAELELYTQKRLTTEFSVFINTTPKWEYFKSYKNRVCFLDCVFAVFFIFWRKINFISVFDIRSE